MRLIPVIQFATLAIGLSLPVMASDESWAAQITIKTGHNDPEHDEARKLYNSLDVPVTERPQVYLFGLSTHPIYRKKSTKVTCELNTQAVPDSYTCLINFSDRDLSESESL